MLRLGCCDSTILTPTPSTPPTPPSLSRRCGQHVSREQEINACTLHTIIIHRKSTICPFHIFDLKSFRLNTDIQRDNISHTCCGPSVPHHRHQLTTHNYWSMKFWFNTTTALALRIKSAPSSQISSNFRCDGTIQRLGHTSSYLRIQERSASK